MTFVMLAEGEIPAMLSPDIPRLFLQGDKRIVRLFPNYKDMEIAFFRQTGIFPINHQAVIRRDVFEKEPWVVINLLKAFNKASEIAEAQRQEHVEYHLATGLLSGDAKTALLQHGVNANRKVIETIAQYSLEQGLTPRLIKVDELYAPNALDT